MRHAMSPNACSSGHPRVILFSVSNTSIRAVSGLLCGPRLESRLPEALQPDSIDQAVPGQLGDEGYFPE